MSADGRDGKPAPRALDLQTLGSILFAAIGVYWLLGSVMSMAGHLVNVAADDYPSTWGFFVSGDALVVIGALGSIPIVFAWLMIVYRSGLAGAGLPRRQLLLSPGALAAVGIRGLGLCLVLDASVQISFVSIRPIPGWGPTSWGPYITTSYESLLQFLLGAPLALLPRRLLIRLCKRSDIWKR